MNATLGRVREPEAAATPRLLEPGEDAERLRVPLVSYEVRPLALRQRIEQPRGGELLEVLADRALADVAERRIAEVVREARGGDAVADVARVAAVGQREAGVHQPAADQVPERATDRRDLETVREPRVDVVVDRQREHLRLVRQPPERSAEQDAVVVALVGRARERRDVRGDAVARIGEQPLPVQRVGHVVPRGDGSSEIVRAAPFAGGMHEV
jgi:hypothetical protein